MNLPGEYVKDKIVCFSGRFDIPHLGHWLTVLRLLEMGAAKVKIIALDYEDRIWYIQKVKQFFDEVIYLSGHDKYVEVIINKTHFAEMTKTEWETYGCDVYASGNNTVLEHMNGIGVKTVYMDPAYNIHASNYVLNDNV